MPVMYTPNSELRKDGQPVGLNRRRVPASSRIFANFLGALMQERKLTTSELAGRLGYSDQSTVGHILAARISFPVKRAGDFADALGLSGPGREDFIDQAHLSICSDRVQAMVSRAHCAEPDMMSKPAAATEYQPTRHTTTEE